ncbi:MAG: SEC-C domain-containing protein [Micromonosporaceae bacterium]
MPQVWTPDDLLFADVRAAHFEPAQQVAEDLLAAAGEPGSRLEGVATIEASFRAAVLLIAAGKRDRAEVIARQLLQEVRGSPEEAAVACMLARLGDRDVVEALAAPILAALRERPDPIVMGEAAGLAINLADHGEFDLAVRIADEVMAACGRWKSGAGRSADPSGELGDWAEDVRRAVRGIQQDVQDWEDGRRVDEPGMQPAMLPPWPALSGSCLLWWPEAEYQRIVRQVPDVRSFLGVTWRDHTAMVESAMLALVPPGPVPRRGGASGYSLVAAEFEYFCGYLKVTGADPRQATAMTGLAARLIDRGAGGGHRQPAPWPPGKRSRCWCGSGARYGHCCQRHS